MKTSICILTWLVLVVPCQARVIYVDANTPDNNDGSSWTKAYKYLQDALADANSDPDANDIWVAEGVYTPDSNAEEPNGTGDRTATFQLISGVGIYGGFPSVGDPNWNDRDPNVNKAVLNGDLARNDDHNIEPGPGGGVPGEDCADAGPINRGETPFSTIGSTTDGSNDCAANQDIWHVYTADVTGNLKVSLCGSDYDTYLAIYDGNECPPTTLLECNDDFCGLQSEVSVFVTQGSQYMIRIGGHATDTGNGVINVSYYADNSENSYHVVTGSDTGATAVLDGFIITAGNADEPNYPNNAGGGMLNYDSNTTVTNCEFTSNSSSYGGGMINLGSRPIVTGCIFTGNLADYAGGGMYNDLSSPTVTNCTFTGNSSANGGGGMLNYDSNTTVTNCEFTSNSSSYGGGMYDYAGSPTVTDCTFTVNSAYNLGGGMCNDSSSPTVTDCTFSGNSADDSGGGMCNYGGSPTVTNCTFNGNWADYGGGGMCNGVFNSPGVTNCTFNGNWADYGGGMLNNFHSNPTVTNCILWGNTASSAGNEISNRSSSIPLISYCDIADCLSGGSWDTSLGLDGGGNIDQDPCFADPGNWVDVNDPNIAVEPNDPNAVWVDGDYHLKSQGWRWDTERQTWAWDDVTSRCIDAGNPGSPLSEELLSVPTDPNNEWGENVRINMGAYGGTAEASIPPHDWAILSDITNDGIMDFNDFAHFAALYGEQGEELPADFNRDNAVDYPDSGPILPDLRLLCEDWLKETTWH